MQTGLKMNQGENETTTQTCTENFQACQDSNPDLCNTG